MLFKTTCILRQWNCFLSCIATDDKDGHGLKLEKVGQTFSSCYAIPAKNDQKKNNS